MQQSLKTLFSNNSIPGELCRRLNTNKDMGLTPQQAADILTKTGPNMLTPSTKTPGYIKFIHTLTHGKVFEGFLLKT